MPEDCFSLLGLPRSAALAEADLQRAYLERSRESHPDQAGGDETRAAALNAARDLLASPARRLRHLIELEFPDAAARWSVVPMDEGMMALFSRVGAAVQRAAALAKEHDSARSALARALLADRMMREREALEHIGEELDALSHALAAELPAHEQRRDAQALQHAQARLAYLEKWRAQICEALMKLV